MVAARKQMSDGKSQSDSTSEKPAGGDGKRHSNYNNGEAVLKVQECNEA